MAETGYAVVLRSYKDDWSRDRLYSLLCRHTGVGAAKVEAGLSSLPVVIVADIDSRQAERLKFALEMSGGGADIVSDEEAAQFPNLRDIDPAEVSAKAATEASRDAEAPAVEEAAQPQVMEKRTDHEPRKPGKPQGVVTGVATEGVQTPPPEPKTPPPVQGVTGVPTHLSENDQWAVAFEPGTMIDGKYRIEELLGVGGMGAVYKATHVDLNEFVALKVMLPSLLRDEEAVKRFQDEARIGMKLRHPSIVATYDCGTSGEARYLWMEYVDGPSLRQLMDQLKNQDAQMPLDRAVGLIEQVCGALAYAHEFTIHRDVKPANILLAGLSQSDDGAWRPEGDDWDVVRTKLTDFGLAKLMSPSRFTLTSRAMGTPYYMAPEQTLASKDVDHRADVYAVGAVCYELLTGRVPMGALRWPSTLRGDVPQATDEVLQRALEPDPDDRWPDIEALWAAFVAAASGQVRSKREEEQLKAANLRRVLDEGILEDFVAEHKGEWDHGNWVQLLDRLEREDYWPVAEEGLRKALEDRRIEWQRRELEEREQELHRQELEAEQRRQQDRVELEPELTQVKHPQQASEAMGASRKVAAIPPDEHPKAGFWRRLCATIVDIAFLNLSAGIVLAALPALMLPKRPTDYEYVIIGNSLAALGGAAYYVLLVGLCGRTLGKLLCGVRIVRIDGTRVGFWRSLWRYMLGGTLAGLPLWLGFLSVGWHPQKQGWHDRLFKTYALCHQSRSKFGLVMRIIIAIGVVTVWMSLLTVGIVLAYS